MRSVVESKKNIVGASSTLCIDIDASLDMSSSIDLASYDSDEENSDDNDKHRHNELLDKFAEIVVGI